MNSNAGIYNGISKLQYFQKIMKVFVQIKKIPDAWLRRGVYHLKVDLHFLGVFQELCQTDVGQRMFQQAQDRIQRTCTDVCTGFSTFGNV